jgi:hypothetical protein
MLSAHINLILNSFNGQPDMQILHKNILQSFNMLTADISSVFYCYNTATACWEAVVGLAGLGHISVLCDTVDLMPSLLHPHSICSI